MPPGIKVEKELATKEWAESEFKGLTRIAIEAKKIALAVKKSLESRTCEKEDDIKTIMSKIQFGRNVKIITVIAFCAFFATWVTQLLRIEVQSNKAVITAEKVEKSVTVIKAATEQNTVLFKSHIAKVEKEKKKEEEKKVVEKKADKMKSEEDLNTILKAIKKSGRRR